MNKEEILSKARKENKGMDEAERANSQAAARFSFVVGIVICILMYWIDDLFLKTRVIAKSCLLIHLCMDAAYEWFRAIKERSKGAWILASITTALALYMVYSLCHYLHLVEMYG